MLKKFFMILFLTFLPVSAMAARDTCERAARLAAAEEGVPAPILLAITLVETNRDGAAWPWTLNHGGRGHWFASAQEAERAVVAILENGGTADIGCFQINSRWHGSAFTSVDRMLDPVENALYAARYLLRLHAERGDWAAAISAYHSRDPDRGRAYLDRVAQHMGLTNPTANQPPRRNRLPLLGTGDPASAGTIVPRMANLAPLIGGQ